MQWLMLQQNQPEDFVIATGVQHSVRDFVNAAAGALDLEIAWEGSGVNEVGRWNGQEVIRVDPRYFRPAEVDNLVGDAARARERLGWVPKITIRELVAEMVREDLKRAERDELLRLHGQSALDPHGQ
jgi:GDPmannose 4,6-dehydratase